jgi:hypothetical protein
MGGDGNLGGAGPGAVGADEAEILQALGIGGKRRILRFAALALGVAGILGGVGIHHAMAKRKAGSIAASRAATPAAPGPLHLASRELEAAAAAPTPEGRPRPGATTGSSEAVKEPLTDSSNALARDRARPPSKAPGETKDDEVPTATGESAKVGTAGTAGHGSEPRASGAPAPVAKANETKGAEEGKETKGAEEGKETEEPEEADAPVGPSAKASRKSAGPEEVEFARTLATCRSRLDRGHAQQAARACREALAVHPDSADALAVLAHAELNQKHLAQAITEARRAIALDPALAEPYLILGGALQDTGHSHEAGVAYRAYLARAPHGKYADELRVIVSTM